MSVSNLARQGQEPPPSHGRLIIGIDLATYRCCVAFATVYSDKSRGVPEVKVFSEWKYAYESRSKDPLTALYMQKRGPPITGMELDHFMRDIGGDPDSDPFDTQRFFRLWKLLFHDAKDNPVLEELQHELYKKLKVFGKTPEDLLRTWVKLTYEALFEKNSCNEYRLKSGGKGHLLDLEVVVAVPPGRSSLTHDLVAQAFVQEPIHYDQISLVSEPEAMFRSWIQSGEDSHSLRVGQSYLITDGGGGTCNLVRYLLLSLQPLSFEQEFGSESVICGAETISNNFEKLAARKIPSHYPASTKALEDMRGQFDRMIKDTFGKDNAKTTRYIRQPWDRNEYLEFSHDEIADCFLQCAEMLVGGIWRQLRIGKSKTVEHLVLGGGLFKNEYIMKIVRDKFKHLNICELSSQKSHVAKGAVLARLYAENDFISSRPVLRSKAVITNMQVTPEIMNNKPLYNSLLTWVDEKDELEYFYAAQWLLKQSEVDVRHANETHEFESESTFESARIREFAWDDKAPKFQDTIVTVNYSPGNEQWAAFRKEDQEKGHPRLINQKGVLIPEIEEYDSLAWGPGDMDIKTAGLEVRQRKGRTKYRILRYSILMKLREVGTTYHIKAWELKKKVQHTRKAKFSKPVKRRSVFQMQQISQNLANSFKLDGINEAPDGINQPAVPLEHEVSAEPSFESRQPAPNLFTTREYVASPKASFQAPSLARSYPQTTLEVQDTSPVSVIEASVELIGQNLPSHHVNPRKRKTPTDKLHQRRQVSDSRSPLGNARPQQQQEIGSLRPKGGCWTCLLGHRACPDKEPVALCYHCERLGLSCIYGCPSWWYDENIRAQQQQNNKRLIQEHMLQQKNGRKLQTEHPSLYPWTTPPLRTQMSPTNSGQDETMLHQRPRSQLRDGSPRPERPLHEDTFGTRVEQSHTSGQYDLYGASPPPRKYDQQTSTNYFNKKVDPPVASHFVRKTTLPSKLVPERASNRTDHDHSSSKRPKTVKNAHDSNQEISAFMKYHDL